MNWYFTFGQAHEDKWGNSLANNYVVITGTWGETRDKMFQARGAKWSFQYNHDEFMPQIKEYGLTQISLEKVRII